MSDASAENSVLTPIALAHELGVSASAVMDFMRVEGVHRLDEVGAGKIRALVAASLAADAAQEGGGDRPPVAVAGPKSSPEGQDSRAVDLRVTRVMLSKRTVLAQHPNGNEVICAVRTTEHLKAGMILRDCQPNGDWQSWAYQGRLPRSMGDMQNFYPQPTTQNQP